MSQLPMLNYFERGAGSPALVFVHGMNGSAKAWQAQLDAFPEHHCLALDLPGHGKSNARQ